MNSPTPSAKSTSPDTPTPSACPANGRADTSSETTPGSPSPKTRTEASPSRNSPPNANTIQNLRVKISTITTASNGPNRLDEDPERIRKLAQAIATEGLINPITLRAVDGRLEILAGRRRLAAFKLLGRASIPATIRETTNHQAATIQLAENVARSNLSPVEEATQLASAVKEHPAGVDGVAAAIGRSVNWVLDRLDMIDWPESLLTHVHTAKISMAAAKRLARIAEPERREYYIDQAARCGINARTAALWLQDANSIPTSDNQLSEKCVPATNTTYRTKTEVECFVCNEWRDLAQTTPARVCHQCINDLGHGPTLVSRQSREPEPSTDNPTV